MEKDDKVVWGWPLRRDRSLTFSRPLNVECHRRRGEEEKNLSPKSPAWYEIASDRTIGIGLAAFHFSALLDCGHCGVFFVFLNGHRDIQYFAPRCFCKEREGGRTRGSVEIVMFEGT